MLVSCLKIPFSFCEEDVDDEDRRETRLRTLRKRLSGVRPWMKYQTDGKLTAVVTAPISRS